MMNTTSFYLTLKVKSGMMKMKVEMKRKSKLSRKRWESVVEVSK